jgi:hypothetical protein
MFVGDYRHFFAATRVVVPSNRDASASHRRGRCDRSDRRRRDHRFIYEPERLW